MTDRLRLTDDAIRSALTPPDDGAVLGLGQAIRESIRTTRPRRYWWTPLRSVFGPFGQSRELQLVVMVASLLAALVTALLVVGTKPDSPFLGDTRMFHGGPARTGEMAGPGPVRGATVLWTASLDGPVANGMPALDGDRLVVADGGGAVTVLSASTGQKGWSRALPKPASSPALAGDVVIVGAGDGEYGLDAGSGTTRWMLPSAQPVTSAPAISGNTAIVGLPDGSVVALDIASGQIHWRTPIGGAIDRAPAVAGGLVFAGGSGGAFAALDVASGRVVWSHVLGPGQVSTPAARDGRVYVASGIDETAAQHVLFAFAIADGREVWRFMSPGGEALYIGAVGPDRVYAVSLGGFVYALDRGSIAWRFRLGAAIGSLATLSRGILYVSGSDGTIVALDSTQGSERWRVSILGGPGPALVANGRLWAATDLGQVVAFQDVGTAASPR
jgi:outer membrane protein assembly factor BamB